MNRLHFGWFALVTICLSDFSYSSIGNYRHILKANVLLKGWRRKAEEQRLRLFDRLPQSVEAEYTTVSSN